jgi:ligand-binding SRPBCC domain-containing protein
VDGCIGAIFLVLTMRRLRVRTTDEVVYFMNFIALIEYTLYRGIQLVLTVSFCARQSG